mgnify:CR=1 FL=1
MEKRGLVQLYLLLSLIVFSLLARYLGVPGLAEAAFACVSAPVLYTMAYYRERAAAVGAFVKKKRVELERAIPYEMAALAAAYVMGFLMFASLGYTDIATYTIAFVASQTMRLADSALIDIAERAGVDPGHPIVALILSSLVASLHALFVYFLYYQIAA